MSVYKYIAQTNPDAAYEVCKKYGFFQVADIGEMAEKLESIVASGGEDSLRDVMSVHPDREVIIEIFEKKSLDKPHTKDECGCQNSSKLHRRRLFAGADGKQTTTNQTNTYILIGALMVSLAIISSIKKGQ